jgi:hypothetical protein
MRLGCKNVLLACCLLAATAGAGSSRRSDGEWETGRDAVEGRVEADSSTAGEWILEELVRNQRENLALDGDQRLDRTRAVVCKLRGGMGNRIQGMITCLALGLAMRRSTLFDWPLIDEDEDSSGLMPCSISELFMQPPGFGEWEYAVAVSGLPPREVESRTAEAYKSMPVRRSGEQPDWRDILLCSNVTSLLEDVPLFAVGSWRYLPTTMSNENHKEHFSKFLPVDQHGDVPFFRVSPALALFLLLLPPAFFSLPAYEAVGMRLPWCSRLVYSSPQVSFSPQTLTSKLLSLVHSRAHSFPWFTLKSSLSHHKNEHNNLLGAVPQVSHFSSSHFSPLTCPLPLVCFFFF